MFDNFSLICLIYGRASQSTDMVISGHFSTILWDNFYPTKGHHCTLNVIENITQEATSNGQTVILISLSIFQ